jgi:Rnl2 family RNA ligase
VHTVIQNNPIKNLYNVYYSETFDFYAFDVYVTLVTVNPETTEHELISQWLTFDEATEVFEKSGFSIHAKPLIRGSLNTVLQYNPEFNSTLPSLYFPDHLPLNVNICEGIVIKPANTILHLLSNDRAIIKKKNKSFMEKMQVPLDKMKTQKEKNPSALFKTEQGLLAWNELTLYITSQRLAGCESKHGVLTRRTQGTLIGMLSKDALDDFIKENAALWANVHADDRKVVTRSLSDRCRAFVTNEMLARLKE